MIPGNIFMMIFAIIIVFLAFKILSRTSFLHIVIKYLRSLEDWFYVEQFYKVPQHNEHFQENQLYNKVFTYLTSLPALEDSDFINLFSGPKSNDIILRMDSNQAIRDTFLEARVAWTNENSDRKGSRTFVLRLRKKDKRRILRPYLQQILSVAEDVDQRNKEIKLYMNIEDEPSENGSWRSVPFSHPATMDTVIMDGDVKNKVKADMETFLKSKQYYHRLGRVWKRSYLLYGPSGTGKSSFIAAAARFLNYNVYNIDVSRVQNDPDLIKLLLQTRTRSVIVIEDLDKLLAEKSQSLSGSGILNFMDGIISCCGEERVMMFTISSNNKDHQLIDQPFFRPGRIDVHINFPLCDFSAFKSLASSYLGVREHKLFAQVEEVFQNGASLSPAEIGEIMICNRNSSTRALKSVITALQSNSKAIVQRPNQSELNRSADDSGVFCRESVHTVREFRRFYGIFRMGSRRKEESHESNSGLLGKEGSQHET